MVVLVELENFNDDIGLVFPSVCIGIVEGRAQGCVGALTSHFTAAGCVFSTDDDDVENFGRIIDDCENSATPVVCCVAMAASYNMETKYGINCKLTYKM